MATTAAAARKSIADTFRELRAKRQIAFMPFIPVGFPDLETTEKILPALERAGASIIEVGIPFSNPIADGPVIQQEQVGSWIDPSGVQQDCVRRRANANSGGGRARGEGRRRRPG
jgi:tryptophan synthase alpha chain